MQDRKEWIRNHIEEALEKGEIVAWYQPIVRSVTGAICEHEALARWHSPELGMISPAEFIPILEDRGLNIVLDELMLRNVVADAKRRIANGVDIQPTSINLSQTDFYDEDLIDRLTQLVDDEGLPHDRFVFEITESACVDSPQDLHRIIEQIHHAGFQVWMDDFGSGYSSLSVLAQYDFDLIKLDMRFLEAFTMEGRGATILRHILAMAKELGIKTLVEGVETIEQYAYLKGCGCDRMQGFFLQKPAPFSFYEENSSKIPDVPYFVGEKKETGAYYDKINFDSTISEDMPAELAVSIKEMPQAMLEASGDELVFLYSNQEYMGFLLGSGMIKADISDPRIRGEWKMPMDESMKKRVNTSLEHGTWISFEDQTPNGQVHGWIKAIAQDRSRDAVCFRIIMDRPHIN